jgi:hypothetical protein
MALPFVVFATLFLRRRRLARRSIVPLLIIRELHLAVDIVLDKPSGAQNSRQNSKLRSFLRLSAAGGESDRSLKKALEIIAFCRFRCFKKRL